MVEKIINGISFVIDYHFVIVWTFNIVFKFKSFIFTKLDNWRISIAITKNK